MSVTTTIRKLRRRRGRERGRLGDLGHDFNEGHRSYVAQLTPGEQLWLRTKPFSAPPSRELATCFRTFAHVIEELNLGLRAQVLDVGCGPGWMSEFFARCGYWVTGVDISEDMVEIARERVAAIGHDVGEGIQAHAEFHAMPVREMPWEERFDAAILYDTMHHFDDELETLKVIRRTLVPGGTLYIREGTMPEPGSESEHALKEEMREYGTLESPFDPQYLIEVVEHAGFEDVRRLVEVDRLIDPKRASDLLGELARVAGYRLGRGEINTILARKPLGDVATADAAGFSGAIERAAPVERVDSQIVVPVAVTNTGRSFWPAAGSFPFPQGVVTVAAYHLGPEGERVELPRTTLPRGVRPGEQVGVRVVVPADLVADARELRIDLVREGLAWFADLGGEPLVVPLER